MTPNHRPSMQLPPGLQGGLLLNKIPPPIPWEAYIQCALRVLHEGKVAVVVLEPQHPVDSDEAVGLFRLLVAVQTPKPPLAWETVPDGVRRHFRVIAQNKSPDA